MTEAGAALSKQSIETHARKCDRIGCQAMKFRSILPQTLRPVLHTLFLPLHQMKTLTARLVGLLASCGKWMGEGGRLHVEIS